MTRMLEISTMASAAGRVARRFAGHDELGPLRARDLQRLSDHHG